VAVDDHIAGIDPDAQHQPAVPGGVAFTHGLLDRDGTAHRVDHTGELGEQPVAHQLEHPAHCAGRSRAR